MRQIRLIIVGVLLLWMNFSIFGIIAQETQPEVPTTKKVEIQQYFPHEPIVISSDSEFESQGFPGSGTYGDPYLIEGFNITSTTGSLIEIRSTETHFTLRNNFLNGLSTALSGIVFNSVRNGRIENNIIKNHISDGIFVQISNDIVITNNTIYENSIGIELEGAYYSRSHNITIRKNTISNNINGIKSYLSGGDAFSGNWITGNQVGMLMNNNLRISNISSNIISDNFQQGIIFANIIHPLFISSNTILNNGYEGIYTSSSNQIIFFNNTISNNGNEGLLLSDSSDSSVLNNTFSNNNGYGVRLDEFTQNITISGNYF
ncbi:MAG: nitrous oxide reductase family maturation protein NosD, partial [Promethearchaeota archaeon]